MIPQLLIDDFPDTIDNQEYTKKLHKAIYKIYPSNDVPHNHNSYQKTLKLRSCQKVWIRVDSVRRTLEAPWNFRISATYSKVLPK